MKNKKEKMDRKQGKKFGKTGEYGRYELKNSEAERKLSLEDGGAHAKQFRYALKKRVVSMLKKRGRLSVEDFVRKLEIPPYYLVKILAKLEKKGVVVRLEKARNHQHHKRDKREGFHLTVDEQKKGRCRRQQRFATSPHQHADRGPHEHHHKHRHAHAARWMKAQDLQYALNG